MIDKAPELIELLREKGMLKDTLARRAAYVRDKATQRLIDFLICEGIARQAQKVFYASKKLTPDQKAKGKIAVEKTRIIAQAAYGVVQTKLKAFDRIVEMLDLMEVEGKSLGDCTRGDLLRAAVRAEEAAGEKLLHASFYRELAGMVGNGTVREAQDRGGIVALLTTTFQQDEANA